ncbi:hypothetical protein [Kitasatospora sp. NPDC059462]|uniref:hypothetical protein n=1 Tax=Kitasatospora sp. NPDC059462 TaxID=3346841 RepID=UPI00369745FD
MVVEGQDRRALERPGEDRVDGVGQAELVPLVLAEQQLGVGVQAPVGRRQDDEALPGERAQAREGVDGLGFPGPAGQEVVELPSVRGVALDVRDVDGRGAGRVGPLLSGVLAAAGSATQLP